MEATVRKSGDGQRVIVQVEQLGSYSEPLARWEHTMHEFPERGR